MAKVCILNSTTNVVENICEVDDINNIPSFIVGDGQVVATDHTGNLDQIWNGSSYDNPVIPDDRSDDQKWDDIREERNRLLVETDWTGVADLTMSSEMTTYRQALRDLPSTESDPDDIVWPTKP